MAKLLSGKILSNKRLAPDIFALVFQSKFIAEKARPGQFVNVKCCEGINTVLRRPISICSADKSSGSVTLVYQVKGVGTAFLSGRKPGQDLDVVGPLGNGFPLGERNQKICIIGGGVGIFPLLFLLKESPSIEKVSFLGFKNKESCVMVEEFMKNSERTFITTDDGGLGEKGFVTDLFKEKISEIKPDLVYTCGPEPMMKKISSITAPLGIRTVLSLEQRMGCGIGACLACAFKIRITPGQDDWVYKRVCKDGPCFEGWEVVFDDGD